MASMSTVCTTTQACVFQRRPRGSMTGVPLCGDEQGARARDIVYKKGCPQDSDFFIRQYVSGIGDEGENWQEVGRQCAEWQRFKLWSVCPLEGD